MGNRFSVVVMSPTSFPSPGDLPHQASNLGLLHCRQTLPSEPPGDPWGEMPGSVPSLRHYLL